MKTERIISKYSIIEEGRIKRYRDFDSKENFKTFKKDILCIEINSRYYDVVLEGQVEIDEYYGESSYYKAYMFVNSSENYRTSYKSYRELYDKYHNEIENFLIEKFNLSTSFHFYDSDFDD